MTQGSRKSRRKKPPEFDGSSKPSRHPSRPNTSFVRRTPNFTGEPAYPLEILSRMFGEFVLQLDSNGAIRAAWASNGRLNARPGALLGRTLRQILGTSTYRHSSELFTRVRRTQRSEEVEYQLEVNGEPRWFCAHFGRER